MTEITLWRDFACPFCYIGETRLQKAIDELGIADSINITFKAYELNPDAPKTASVSTEQRLAMKYGISIDEAERQLARVIQMGEELGLDFKYATSRYASTKDAHRLFKYAENNYGKETVDKLNWLLFDAYFGKNLLISDPDVLTEVGVKAGMKEDEVRTLLESEKYLKEVNEDEQEAYMRGITGVPYMIIDGKIKIPGAMDYDDYLRILRD